MAFGGLTLKDLRVNSNLTQEQAAAALNVSQAYLSMVERGVRPVSDRMARGAVTALKASPALLPVESESSWSADDDSLKVDLGALGYPGFLYLGGTPRRNPWQVLAYALDQHDLDPRVVEALPWLVCQYPDMDWDSLVNHAKLRDRQNRLGFVVATAKRLATKAGDRAKAKQLAGHLARLQASRLVQEDTLCHDSMTQAERRWLKQNRPAEARYWKLLTGLDVDHLDYAPQ
jgi:transcriptional regulator with XRE-family HTH domain